MNHHWRAAATPPAVPNWAAWAAVARPGRIPASLAARLACALSRLRAGSSSASIAATTPVTSPLLMSLASGCHASSATGVAYVLP